MTSHIHDNKLQKCTTGTSKLLKNIPIRLLNTRVISGSSMKTNAITEYTGKQYVLIFTRKRLGFSTREKFFRIRGSFCSVLSVDKITHNKGKLKNHGINWQNQKGGIFCKLISNCIQLINQIQGFVFVSTKICVAIFSTQPQPSRHIATDLGGKLGGLPLQRCTRNLIMKRETESTLRKVW